MVSKLAFSPLRLGPLTLKNRFIKAATFEGVMPRGTVSDALIDFHTEVARRGRDDDRGLLRDLPGRPRSPRHRRAGPRPRAPAAPTDRGRACRGCARVRQIGHAGLVANTLSNRTPTLAPSTRVSAPAMGLVRAATAEQLDAVVDGFGTAAQNAVDAGFDALEIHMGHGYLLSSFFSPNLNRRTDRFGGDTVRRAELARRVAERVRATVGDSVAVTAKFNMDDGVRGGFWLDDSIPTARLLGPTGTSTRCS